MRKLWRVVFSRYFLSGLFIAADVLLLSLLIVYASYYSYMFLTLHLLAVVAVFLHIVNAESSPDYKLPWVILIFLLPAVGPLIYLLFSRRKMTKAENRRLNEIAERLSAYPPEGESFLSLKEASPAAAGKAYAILGEDPIAAVYRGTSSRFYESGEALFADLLYDLRAAKKFIFLEYFIIAPGRLWDEIHRILLNKVRLGVEVRLIYDDVGCMRTLPSDFVRKMNAEGIRCQRFATVTPVVTVSHNNRDHRKICVVDGGIAYTGGVNLADEYANFISRFGYWKDGGVRLAGAAVTGLTRNFLALWDMTAGSASDYARYLSPPAPADDGGYYIPFGSGPYPFYRRSVGKSVFRAILDQAVRYVWITTPYLVIDRELTESICEAARRGVDVRIITPGVADKAAVKIMTKSSYSYLIAAGVRIYEYTPGFIHEKTVIADDEYAVIGTINFDYRSLIHHFENAVWIYRSDTVLRAKEAFGRTERQSHRISAEEAKLSRPERWVYNTVRIFRPLL